MITSEIINLSALIIFLICIGIYAVKLRIGMKKPETAKRGLLNVFYGLWVNRMIDSEETIVAVQTMRNLIMATTFISSSILVLLGLLIRIPGNGLGELINLSATSTEIIAQYKLLLLISAVVFSLIMFLLSLRQMVRFTVLIGIPLKEIEAHGTRHVENDNKDKKECKAIDAKALRTDVFLKAMNRFTYGMRGIFFAIVIILWFINVYAFIGGTIILTILLIRYQDIKTPCVEETPI